jgi:hypothetical protein
MGRGRSVRAAPTRVLVRLGCAVAPAAIAMTSQGTAAGRFQRAIVRGHVMDAEMAAREMGGLSLAEALSLCELLAKTDRHATSERRCAGSTSGSSRNGCHR